MIVWLSSFLDEIKVKGDEEVKSSTFVFTSAIMCNDLVGDSEKNLVNNENKAASDKELISKKPLIKCPCPYKCIAILIRRWIWLMA